MGKVRAEHVTTLKIIPSRSSDLSKLLKKCWEKIENVSANDL
jgi:hypothetical protein